MEIFTLAEAPAELASAPFETSARMTQIAMAERPEEFIADEVLPRVTAPYKFDYTKAVSADQLTIPDTRASRAGRLNEVEFGAALVTDSCEDEGLISYVPHRDILTARAQQSAWDPVAEAVAGLGGLMALAREKRVADLVFGASSYPTGHKATLSGASQWSDATSDPVKTIMKALDVPIIRPNTLVFGQATWTDLRLHPKVVQATKMPGAGGGDKAAGVAMRQAVAELFEVRRVLVGETWHQTAARGQTEVYARLWGKHAAALHIRRPTGTRDRMPTWGFTAVAMALETGLSEEPTRGVGRGSRAIKVSETIRELVSWNTAGYFWQNAVA